MNKSAFFKIENELQHGIKDVDYLKIINPQRFGVEIDKYYSELSRLVKEKIEPTWQEYMRRSVLELSTATHIVMLPFWNKSEGAKIEHYLAKILGIKIYYDTKTLLTEVEGEPIC